MNLYNLAVMKVIMKSLFVVLVLLFGCKNTNKYDEAKGFYQNGKIAVAKDMLTRIIETDKYYDSAQILLSKIRIIEKQRDSIKHIEDSLNKIKISFEKRESALMDLKQAIEEVKSYKYNSTFSSVDDIIKELEAIWNWTEIAENAKKYTDKEYVSLKQDLIKGIVNLQVKAFPILRKEYVSVCREKLWEEDVNITCYGAGYTTIELLGYHFAANKNCKETYDALHHILYNLRFKRLNLKWSKYSEYVAYTINNNSDKELMILLRLKLDR